LNLYQAIARKLLDDAQAQLLSLMPSPPPILLDFPSQEVYGEEFGVPAAQRLRRRKSTAKSSEFQPPSASR
jgi:hypothetical protein